MDHRAALILAASLLCGSVHAGYAQLAPPLDWSGGGGPSAGPGGTYGPASNAASYSNGALRSKVTLPVGGRPVQVPAAMRIAANAPRALALRVGTAVAVGGSGLLTGGLSMVAFAALPFALDWFNRAGVTYSPEKADFVRDGDFVYIGGKWHYGFSGVAETPEAACRAINPVYVPGNFSADGLQCNCTFNGEIRDGIRYSGEARKDLVPVPFSEILPKLAETPLPETLPNIVFPIPWPIELPEIQPTFVPTGNPIPNPNYNPSAPVSPSNQPFVQPGVNVLPAPSLSAPWQVDLQPVNRPTSSPNPGSEPVPNVNPDGSPKPNEADDPREGRDEDKQDFCDKHPDVIACQKMDEPEDPGELKTKAVDLDFQVQSGYAGSAVCPAPMTYEAFGHVLSLSWQPFCDSLAMVKNLLLAFAWISAAFILLGAKKE